MAACPVAGKLGCEEGAFAMSKERELLRRAAEADAKMHAAVAAQKKHLAEQRQAAERQLAAASADLSRRKEAALETYIEAQQESRFRDQAASEEKLVDLWPEAEDAAEKLKETQGKVAECRAEASALKEAEQTNLDVARAIHRMYAGATGVRWEPDAKAAEPSPLHGRPMAQVHDVSL
eukprot:TRINITY_DN22302_c0_g1_i2.p1 TRINITY_DN22302_c0_g1~~TRINITY_DN22302_c0_g1_i2.p1  ORF type:complete len:178 (-),score=69.14 TRINITY_DN22302_c0_g1_i2:225-758(-)